MSEIEHRVIQARRYEGKIKETRECYRPVAAKASFLYFLINELRKRWVPQLLRIGKETRYWKVGTSTTKRVGKESQYWKMGTSTPKRVGKESQGTGKWVPQLLRELVKSLKVLENGYLNS
ncbi:Dynein heavy chain 11, axonemal [Cricetulus griseus]|uniref:Dynein heavy chain 11, axonemal n=1 Tax=Cricetulus griseus TaxID=10029 RepID=G3ID02_CRIGR|nr:Dynein heavy chain 11, axonemal [Cricetulus griseus]